VPSYGLFDQTKSFPCPFCWQFYTRWQASVLLYICWFSPFQPCHFSRLSCCSTSRNSFPPRKFLHSSVSPPGKGGDPPPSFLFPHACTFRLPISFSLSFLPRWQKVLGSNRDPALTVDAEIPRTEGIVGPLCVANISESPCIVLHCESP